MRRALRVICDRSAFANEVNFAKLTNEEWLVKLDSLVGNKRVKFFHSQYFFDETLASYASERNRVLLRKQLPSLFKFYEGRWFKLMGAMLESEISNQNHCVFMPEHKRRKMQKSMLDCICDDNWTDYQKDHLEFVERKNNLEEACLAIRNQSNDLRKEAKLKSPKSSQIPTFDEYCKLEYDDWVKQCLIHTSDVFTKMIVQTGNDPCYETSKYPYTSAWFVGTLFVKYYSEHISLKIDKNAFVDVAQLCYLNDTDVIISNDGKFMKSAFDHLWKAKNKKFLSTDEFVELIDRTSCKWPSPLSLEYHSQGTP